MTLTKNMSDKELIKKGTEILFKELGQVNATRFLAMSREERLESVERHRKWQEGLDKESFFDEIFSQKDDSAY